jgi:hypothetical protein
MITCTPAVRANAIAKGIDSANVAPANETHELQWLSVWALNDEQAIHHDRLQRDGSEHTVYCAAYARQLYRNELHRRALAELLALRENTTDMDLMNWAARVLLDAGMHAEMMGR